MAFPRINYKFNGLEEAQSMTELLEQKFTSIEKYLHGEESVSCDVSFSKVAPQKNGQIHKIDASLVINGVVYRADATEESFEQAIDEVRSELDKELRRAKDKQSTMDKQAGREAKEKMQEE
jgi:ribosomal subunit interface protein